MPLGFSRHAKNMDGIGRLLASCRLLDENPALFMQMQSTLPPAEIAMARRTLVRAFVISYNQKLAALHIHKCPRALPTREELLQDMSTYNFWCQTPDFAEMTRGLRMSFIDMYHHGTAAM